jgi:HMG box factor
VVAQNPGLANPDISKIIGEQWRRLPQETKDEWKALAEVSKITISLAMALISILTFEVGRKGSASAAVSRVSVSASALW